MSSDPLDVHAAAMAAAREATADDPDEVILDGLEDGEGIDLHSPDGNFEGDTVATFLRRHEGAVPATLEVARRPPPFKGAQLRLIRANKRAVTLNIRRTELAAVAAALLACRGPADPDTENPFSASHWVGSPAPQAVQHRRARRDTESR